MGRQGNRTIREDLDLLVAFQSAGIPVWARTLRMRKSPKGEPEEKGHPKRWQETTPEQYDLWSASRSGAFGVVTGHGLDVLDVDPRNGGDVNAVLDALRKYRVPVIGIANTPGGGIHVYLPSSRTPVPVKFSTGIEYLSKGQFAFAPPSTRPKYPGARYRWRRRPTPESLQRIGRPSARTRAFLASLEGPTPGGTKAGSTPAGIGNVSTVDEAVTLVRTRATGERNTTLFTVTARLVGLGLWDDEASIRILRAAVEVGTPRSEAHRSIKSGMQLGQKRRDDAQEWAALARSNHRLKRRDAISMMNTITDLQERFTTHGPEALGLSCRELGEAINCSHYTASKNLRDLTKCGLLVRESSSADQGDVYSMSGVFESAAKENGKVDTQEPTDTYTYDSPPVECQPFPVPADRLREVSCHAVFACERDGSALPAKVAHTLVAVEAGASTAQEVHDSTSISVETVLKHFRILESAGLVSRQRGKRVQVKPLWGTDLLAALDDWCAAMGIDDVADRRRTKHQAQRDYFKKWATERTGGRAGRLKTSTPQQDDEPVIPARVFRPGKRPR